MTATLDARPTTPRSAQLEADQMALQAPAGLEATKMSLLSRSAAGASTSASSAPPRSGARIDKAALMSTLRAAAAIMPHAGSARRVSTDVDETTSLLSHSSQPSARSGFQDQAQTPELVEAPEAPQGTPGGASESATEAAEAGEQPTALPTLPSMTPWFTRAGLRRRSSTAASMMLPEFDLFTNFEGLPLSLPVQMEEEEAKVVAEEAVQPDAEEEVKPEVAQAPAVVRPLAQRVMRAAAMTVGGVAVGTLFAVIALSMMTLPAEVLAEYQAAQAAAAIAAMRATMPMPEVGALNAYIAAATHTVPGWVMADNVNAAAFLGKPLAMTAADCAANIDMPAAQLLCAAAGIAG